MPAETGPRPLTQEQAKYVGILMLDSRVEPFRVLGQTSSSTFLENGVFQARVNYADKYSRADRYWSQNLFKYNPLETRVKTSRRGNLLVLKDPNDLLESIKPEDIRRVDKNRSYIRKVSPSGYLLYQGMGPNHDIYHIEGAGFSLDEFDQILREADEGTEPPGLLLESFMRVDPALVGTEVWEVLFDYHPPAGDWRDNDGVVIDRQTKALIPRTISWPLDPKRWDPYFEEKLKAASQKASWI